MNLAEESVIPSGWGPVFGFAGMATTFVLDGVFYAAPGISDYQRKSLTVKEARYLVTEGKAIRAEVPHL